MRPKNRVGRVVRTCLLAAALLASGCTDATTDQPSDATAPNDAAFPRTVDHAMGSTEIPAQPERIAALDQTFVDAAFSLDLSLVGFTDVSPESGGLPGYLEQFHSTLGADAESLGSLDSPNLETLASLRPDLIVSAKIRHEELYDELGQIAPTVFADSTGPDWKENLLLLGKSVGIEDRAEQLLADYERRAQAIGDAIREKEGRNPTISVVRFVGETRLYQKDSFSGIVLADTGLARPASQDVDEFALAISEERISDADADHIFVGTYDIAEAHEDEQRFTSNPLWGQLDGEIHRIDDEVWGTAVGLQGAHAMLDDLAEVFGVSVDPQ
ncbi:MAG: iron-siderophore ABC transporter substrate-binding protein [Actinomycetota bacterium]